MTMIYVDCFNGAAGDMIVAALTDAGIEQEKVLAFVNGLGLTGFAARFERVKRHGISALRFVVDLDATVTQPHRHLSHVLKILDAAPLSDGVRQKAASVFRRLAEAEARVHATTVEKVHFHEVGAVDAIVDVTTAAWCMEALGVTRMLCSPIPTGHGTVHCAHGEMPVPAPATAELLRGVPLAEVDVPEEMTTPTGAAILTTLAGGFGSPPARTVRAIGYGAGSRDSARRANVMRVFLADDSDPGEALLGDEIVVLETNLDDASPQIIGRCVEQLLAGGALDVYTVPIQMKKHRPGVLLTVLCALEEESRLTRIIFSETPTFGVRRTTMSRRKLNRRFETVTTPYGPIRMKVGSTGEVVTVTPEYDDCRTAAMRHNVAIRVVMDAARRAWNG